MHIKSGQLEKAIQLRKNGQSYSQIASLVKVSRSTLSLWLRNVLLTKRSQEILNSRRREGQLKGGLVKREFREAKETQILENASQEIKNLSSRELWLLGTLAYWCEGAKQKEGNISARVVFVNSDPFLIRLFIKWLKQICQISEQNIKYNLSIHETADKDIAIKYWSKVIGIDTNLFGKSIIKKHKISTNRKYRNDKYYGLIRITVLKSTDLNRKIKGWILGISGFI